MILLLFNAILYYTFLLLTNQLPINCNTFYSIIHHIYIDIQKKKTLYKAQKITQKAACATDTYKIDRSISLQRSFFFHSENYFK